MNKIKLGITGCMGRMGKQLIKSSKKDKSFKLTTLTESIEISKKISGIKPELNSFSSLKKFT
jgi:4-hydroxy-tetrahydrodipicolinate reductase